MKTKKDLSEKELTNVFGGYNRGPLCGPGTDDIDCTTELTSSKTTTFRD